MRIAYCTNVRLPSERAHGHQVAAVCDALADLGHAVTIFAPFRRNPVQDDYWTYYGAKRDVQLTYLGRFDPIDRVFFPGVIALWTLNALLRRALRRAFAAGSFDLLYTRSPALLPALLKAGIPTALELHRLPRLGRRALVRRCNRCRIVACLTTPMRDELVSWGVDPLRVIIAGDAVDPAFLRELPSREEAVKKWQIPSGVTVIGYAGQLRSMGLSKGIEVLLQAVEILANRGFPVHALIAGGPETVRGEFERGLSQAIRSHVTFAGTLPHRDIPFIFASADVLAYPAPASDHPFYRRDTSPLKLFEYMAAGKPIVSADLPPVRDILDEHSALLVSPGDADAFAGAIERVIREPHEARKRADKARALVTQHSWQERMRRIIKAATVQA